MTKTSNGLITSLTSYWGWSIFVIPFVHFFSLIFYIRFTEKKKEQSKEYFHDQLSIWFLFSGGSVKLTYKLNHSDSYLTGYKQNLNTLRLNHSIQNSNRAILTTPLHTLRNSTAFIVWADTRKEQSNLLSLSLAHCARLYTSNSSGHFLELAYLPI